jgi:hypothetical protein
VAVGDERAHAEFLCKKEGLSVGGGRPLRINGTLGCVKIPEDSQRVRFHTSLLVGSSQAERSLS